MSLNFALYSGYEKRKITRKVLADKLGVTAFHSSEIVSKNRISDRVMEPHGQEPVAPLPHQAGRPLPATPYTKGRMLMSQASCVGRGML